MLSTSVCGHGLLTGGTDCRLRWTNQPASRIIIMSLSRYWHLPAPQESFVIGAESSQQPQVSIIVSRSTREQVSKQQIKSGESPLGGRHGGASGGRQGDGQADQGGGCEAFGGGNWACVRLNTVIVFKHAISIRVEFNRLTLINSEENQNDRSRLPLLLNFRCSTQTG